MALTQTMPCWIEDDQDFKPENWRWDVNNKSPEVQLSSCQLAAYFHVDPVDSSIGTAGVRGTKGFTTGEHYWEVIFLEPPHGTSVMVGVGTKKALLHLGNYQYINLLGRDEESWGLSYKGTTWHNGKYQQYTEPFYDQTTVIGVHLNLYNGTLTYYRNGKSLGVAFRSINRGEELYPIICSTAAETEMELGMRSCRFNSLQEKCCFTIMQAMKGKQAVDKLPLPTVIKSRLKEQY
ncbi:SPRY domain-containing SOCS box protein 3-like [Branchiostoma floridae]|uniref:SPRY domain-containing SOCS box protein 3 n=1 Tax=Branchiostoma floridae TaxID=7739 RepID=C3Y974_BRAFL|nr:SPRY domain-containing SOCS box protein 3-like [Branchiostoma floridae]XP_035694994.1 SPRY domain-containing SOCS box protein 3-like [Branchiostoma floridae]XP_035694995.1 SPRY domain-containing SOCS box protein 3-like [Branchiostoma floridae]|eukprot:XP_002607120.1 hypothetical protein BRAFLDRAFT_118668 [Branchiostoma floridae]